MLLNIQKTALLINFQTNITGIKWFLMRCYDIRLGYIKNYDIRYALKLHMRNLTIK